MLVAKSVADCPAAGGIVELSWLDSGRDRQAFTVLRGVDASMPLTELSDVDGLTHDDLAADCQPGPASAIYYYRVWDRNSCTGDAIPDP